MGALPVYHDREAAHRTGNLHAVRGATAAGCAGDASIMTSRKSTHAGARYRGNRSFEVVQVDSRSPGPGEVSIRIAYCGICGTDLHVFHGNMDARVGFDRIIGHEMSGLVAATGEDCGDWEEGQPVVVRPLNPCRNCPACRGGLDHICHIYDVSHQYVSLHAGLSLLCERTLYHT